MPFPYVVPAAEPRRSIWYMGGLLNVLATAADTGGQFSLIEVKMGKGASPPRHQHTHEDESFFVLDGEMEVGIGADVHRLGPGDFVYLPRGVPHHFRILSDTARFLDHFSPAGLEQLFLDMGTPAELPPPQGPPTAEFLGRVQALQKQLGIEPAPAS